MTKPLDGMLVLSIDQAVAAPYCASRLADAGARVIKVERAEGDFARGYDHEVHGESAFFLWLNRGKESLVADLKNPDDRALLHRILAKADVFIQNLAPGATDRMGLGSDELRKRYPRLTTVDISGYGDEGPYAEMKAYDFLVQAESGLISVTGSKEEMGRVGVSICDIACGMFARISVLEALLLRERTGEGSQIKVSLFGGMTEWMSPWLLHEAYGVLKEQRIGLNHPAIVPYGAYACAGGDMILIAVQNDREWRKLCRDVLGNEALADDERFCTNTDRVAHRDGVNAEINAVFRTLSRDRVREMLSAAGIAFGAINSVADVLEHPALRRVPIETPVGTIETVAPPASFAGADQSFGPVPRLGEHSAAIRSEFLA
ncbi:CoA transferase [Nisaea acidiphila]|uniref:CoA transferase n=1 Tax=Nisaea acidiphila TaxID=1862145 RepID=A0A9J7AXN8_9PROT|nr:CaiB/BaiF CoA-transferase family protein [Nisaea acidiphila]UUX51201.1 CoA transferase [Nisaea acidiphila]